MSNNVAWKMGVEAKCKQEPATVTIPTEEYRTLIEANTKLDIICRMVEGGTSLDANLFNQITGYEVEEEKKDVNAVRVKCNI